MDDVSTKVTPGLGGFLAFFVLALVLWLLMRSMNARLRRMRYREEQQAAAAARAGSAGPSAHGTPVDGQGHGDVVHHEGDHGQDVEDLVEPEPPR